MLCIKKNKCFVLRKINAFQLCCYYRKKQTAYFSPCNPFRPVETRSDLLKPVETRFNPFRSVQTRFQASPPPPPSPLPLLPPSPPSSPFSPFFLGGGEGEGGGRGREGGGRGSTTMAPRKGDGGDEVPPPPPDFNKKLSKFSHSFFFKICVIYLPPKGFSQSTAQNYINTYGGLSTKNKIHCGILK